MYDHGTVVWGFNVDADFGKDVWLGRTDEQL